MESGVSYLSSKVERIIETANGQSLIACEQNIAVPCRYPPGFIPHMKHFVSQHIGIRFVVNSYPLSHASNLLL